MPDAQPLGPYRLERVLGTGSFATVWLATDPVLDRQVAVKILADNWSRDHEVRRRFLSEAKVLLTAESPRIVRGFHLGETATGQPYLVMAWADRGTLDDRIEQRRREGRSFAVDEVVGLATEIALALADVHRHGHLHRDVKPTNVLIRSASARVGIPGLQPDETLLLADFGLVRGLEASALTLVAGSPAYMAPEQASGQTQLDGRADLFSLGCILLELLTGDPGGRAATVAAAASDVVAVGELLAAHARDGGEAPPAELAALIARLVDEDPTERPSTADEVVAELKAIARRPGTASPPGAGEPSGPPDAGAPAAALGAATRPRRSRQRLVAAGLGVLALAGAGIGLALTRGGGDGAGGTTTTVVDGTTPAVGPVVVPASSPSPATLGGTMADTAPTETSTFDTRPTEPTDAPAAPATSDRPAPPSAATIAPVTPAEHAVLELPEPDYDFFVDVDSTRDNQTGSRVGTLAEVAAAIVDANPGWEPSDDLDAIGDDDTSGAFTLTNGPSTAVVTLELNDRAGATITMFDIAYE